jgi:glucose/arabinose dehydrogenase
MHHTRAIVGAGKYLLSIGGLLALVLAPLSARAEMAPGLQESVVLSGLKKPTNVRFASDGRIFVTEKSGIIKVFRSLDDTSPVVFADLTTNVMDEWDRGLLGIALDPAFPTKPYVYVLYTYDAPPGQSAPVWNDACDDPVGLGCPTTARLSRLQIGPNNTLVSAEKVLVENTWCAQFPSHNIGDLAFGPDGALYASAGEGANFNLEDYGQIGQNPCADPSGLGGALRAQSVLTGRRPTSTDGAILRVDPETGAALPSNPLVGGTPDADRIIAFGLRNPFRFNFRPGTQELWIADVGWDTTEEINRIPNAAGTTVENFGWPCYEGTAQAPSYSTLPFCAGLYSKAASVGVVTGPYFSYQHGAPPGPPCTDCTGAAVTGVVFYNANLYPDNYRGALFFCDYARRQIWAMPKGANGDPDASHIITINDNAPDPVTLQTGPGGDIFYVNHGGDLGIGDVRRIFASANRVPTAVAAADVTSGHSPLTVHFNASGSTDPDGRIVSYSWDLDGDGKLGDSASPTPTFTYTKSGVYRVQLRVTDDAGLTGTSSLQILVDRSAPQTSITSPDPSLTWSVGDVITFTGAATNPDDPSKSPLPASAYSWSVVLMHCPSDCHAHSLQDFVGVTSGKITAPDHEYPSYLQLRLTVTDSSGLSSSTTIKLQPKTTYLRFESEPPGLSVAVGALSHVAPFELRVIDGSLHSISVPAVQNLDGAPYGFLGWSDRGAASHEVRATDALATYKASFAALNWHRPDDPPSVSIQKSGCDCGVSSRSPIGVEGWLFALGITLRGWRSRARRSFPHPARSRLRSFR